MFPTARLTKRQKKGIAFRQRKHGKTQDNPIGITDNSEEELNVLVLEDQVPVDATQSQQGSQVSTEALVRKRKAGTEGEQTKRRVVVATGKGKQQAGEEEKGSCGGSDEPKLKRRKGSIGLEQFIEDNDGAGETRKESEKTKQRFILFLGNLKYTTTPEAIQAHFSVCDPPPVVRLLTPKPPAKSPTKRVGTSKGCAFLEFKHRGALQQALKLHHSKLDGRQINVELTAGGGGKSLTRMKKLKERNKELDGQRRKRQDPGLSEQRDDDTPRPSATPGAERTHIHKRARITHEFKEEETHQTGKEHQEISRKRRSLVKDFRTGVNAIPIG